MEFDLEKDLATDIVRNEKKFILKAALIIGIIFIIIFFICILSGRYNCSKLVVLTAFFRGFLDKLIYLINILAKFIPFIDYNIVNPIPITWEDNIDIVLWNVRFPRVVAVIFIGGGLAISGANYQGVFQNPLVSESILGVSAGASFGAAIAILLSYSSVMTSVLAFAGGILAVTLTYSTSRVFKGNPTLILVLAGTVISSLFSAGVSIIKYIAPTDTKLPEITFWLMGSFAKIKADELIVLLPLICICGFILYRIRWKLNVMSLGEDEARSLGVNTKQTRIIIIICSTFITAISVCICGMVGWIGVIIPQIVRMIVGPDTRKLIPCSFFVGGIFLMVVDLFCRTLIVNEIPVGIVTSIIGAPIFLVILKRVREGWA